MRYQGAGSSFLAPTLLKTPADAFRAHSSFVDYVEGFDLFDPQRDPSLCEEALQKARSYETSFFSSASMILTEMEGKDRDDMPPAKSASPG
jgi:hypothetical protein